MARTHLSQAPPLREQLEALAHAYHLLESEIEHGRRDLEPELLRLHKRFERALEASVDDDDIREQWHQHLHARAALPAQPPPVDPVVYRGESDTGSSVEIRRHRGELQVWLDGTLLDAPVDADDLRTRGTGLTLRVGDTEFHETFRVSPQAIHALAEFAETRNEPPWDYALELLEDGLLDPHFEITPRGRRALAAAPI